MYYRRKRGEKDETYPKGLNSAKVILNLPWGQFQWKHIFDEVIDIWVGLFHYAQYLRAA